MTDRDPVSQLIAERDSLRSALSEAQARADRELKLRIQLTTFIDARTASLRSALSEAQAENEELRERLLGVAQQIGRDSYTDLAEWVASYAERVRQYERELTVLRNRPQQEAYDRRVAERDAALADVERMKDIYRCHELGRLEAEADAVRIRQAIEALADEWDKPYGEFMGHPDDVLRLRALLVGANPVTGKRAE